MPIFVTPNIIALVILAALFAFGMNTFLKKHLHRKLREDNEHKILRLKPSKVNTKTLDLFASLGVPIVFEIVVRNLGKEIEYFVAISGRHVPRVIHKLEAQEVEDYEVYYHGGTQTGGYLRSDIPITKIDFKKIDLSGINEVGEGAVVQFAFERKQKQEIPANVRLFASAPSAYRAHGILDNIRSSLPGSFVEMKNETFLDRFHSRGFDNGERVAFHL